MAKEKEYTKVVTFRLKPEQFDDLKNRSKQAGRKIGDVVRSAVLGQEVKQMRDTRFMVSLKEICAQGNNLNQLTRLANEMKLAGKLDNDAFLMIDSKLEEYKSILSKLYESEI